jgi:hypothetical protein
LYGSLNLGNAHNIDVIPNSPSAIQLYCKWCVWCCIYPVFWELGYLASIYEFGQGETKLNCIKTYITDISTGHLLCLTEWSNKQASSMIRDPSIREKIFNLYFEQTACNFNKQLFHDKINFWGRGWFGFV